MRRLQKKLFLFPPPPPPPPNFSFGFRSLQPLGQNRLWDAYKINYFYSPPPLILALDFDLSNLSDKTGFETAIQYFLFKTKSSILGLDFDLSYKSIWTANSIYFLYKTKSSILALDSISPTFRTKQVLRRLRNIFFSYKQNPLF